MRGVCHMSRNAQRKTDVNFTVNKYRLLSNVKGKVWSHSLSKFRKHLESPGYGHILLAVSQHILGYDLRWPYPTIHNLRIFCHQPTKFCVILTRICRLLDDHTELLSLSTYLVQFLTHPLGYISWLQPCGHHLWRRYTFRLSLGCTPS